MKKIYLIWCLGLVPTLGHGAQLYVGTGGGNLNVTMPSADVADVYYKCQNSVSVSCQSAAMLISYSGKSGGAGTAMSPYILTGCSFVSCACGINEYLSGNTCKACSNNALGGATIGYHTNTSCQYCASSQLMLKPAPGVVVCTSCPSNGTCDGTTTMKCNDGYYGTTSCTKCPTSGGTPATTHGVGATSITKCCIPNNGTFYDDTGGGVFTGECCYTN